MTTKMYKARSVNIYTEQVGTRGPAILVTLEHDLMLRFDKGQMEQQLRALVLSGRPGIDIALMGRIERKVIKKVSCFDPSNTHQRSGCNLESEEAYLLVQDLLVEYQQAYQAVLDELRK